MQAFSHKIAGGILWNTLQLFFSKAFSYVVILGLAHTLDPTAFGLLGMANVFTGLTIALVNASITAALIQLRGSQLPQAHYDSSRTLVFGLSFLIYLLYLLCVAPLVASFYGEPALHPIIAILALQTMIGAFNVIPRAQLSRKMDFKRLAGAESFAAIIAGITALSLAAAGFGVWSLVAQTLLTEAFQIPLLRRFAKDNGQFAWSKNCIQEIRRFVTFDGLNRGFVYFSKNIDYLLVGKFLGSQALGVYTFAFMTTDILRAQIMNLLNRVMFPVYGQLQGDSAAIKGYYLQIVRYNTLALGPIMLAFILFADTWVPALLGPEWREAVFPMQAMAVGSLIHAFGGTTDSVLKAIGKVDLLFKIHLSKTLLVTIPAFTLGTVHFGIRGAAVAIIIHKLAGRAAYQFFMSKHLGISYSDLMRAAIPIAIGMAVGLGVFHLWEFASSPADLTHAALQTVSVTAIAAIASLLVVRRELLQWARDLTPFRKGKR